MEEKQSFMGADGLDLADTEAVQKWLDEQKAEHEKLEAEFQAKLKSLGITDEDVQKGGSVDLSNLPDDVTAEFTQMLNELDQREADFDHKLKHIGDEKNHVSTINPSTKWKVL